MEQTSLTLPDIGSAINGAYTTLSSQAENMIALYTRKGDMDSVARMESFLAIINLNFSLIVDVGNEVSDTFDKMVDIAQTNEKYKAMYEREHHLRKDEADKIVTIVDAHEKTLKYNTELNKRIEGLQQQLGEAARVKKQKERLEETLTSKEREVIDLKQQLQTAKSRIHSTLLITAKSVEVMKFVRETMLFEGRTVTAVLEYDNQRYYAYKKPGLPTDWDGVMDTPLSAAHRWYWRVETNNGYHYDVLPKADGGIAIAKPKALPVKIKQFLSEELDKTTEFINPEEDLSLREDRLNQLLKELDSNLLDAQIYLQSEVKPVPVVKQRTKPPMKKKKK